jgi:hypothetical protein
MNFQKVIPFNGIVVKDKMRKLVPDSEEGQNDKLLKNGGELYHITPKL